jgi:hypothetical protein
MQVQMTEQCFFTAAGTWIGTEKDVIRLAFRVRGAFMEEEDEGTERANGGGGDGSLYFTRLEYIWPCVDVCVGGGIAAPSSANAVATDTL